ncbi:MAG: hypothetical protein WCR20_22425, partial [Verrucomicrobiota bacterium]
DSKNSDQSASVDPNELLGPGGYGAQNFVAAGSLLPYRINFENATNALARAQFVTVQNLLATNLDLAPFELSRLGFGDRFFAIPPGSQHYERTETLTMNGFRFQVQIEAGLNLATRTVYATFRSLNPTNGLPPTVDIGFLPPENGTGRGQGHLAYVIRAKSGLATGTEIRNVASIVFDQQPAIATDWKDPHNPASGVDTNKQAVVTIDGSIPTSAIANLALTTTNAIFDVFWSGSDLGSGIFGYDVYVQTNGGSWTRWLANYPLTSASFAGQNGRMYCFYTVARDGAGNVQTNPPTVVCAQTLSNYPPVLDPVASRIVFVGHQLVITNHANDPDGVSFSLGAGAPSGASITTNGIFKWTPACAQGSTTNLIRVWATDHGLPRMSSSMVFTVIVPECIEASVGDNVVRAGQRSSVPLRILSTVELTNLAFTLNYPAERFTNFTLTVNSPQVITQELRLLAAGKLEVSFTLPSTSVVHGPTNVGALGFTALPGQSSAFVPLPVADLRGLKPDGGVAGNAFGYPGRVVTVGNEPLLEAVSSTNREVLLILYGIPGTTNQILSGPNVLTPGSWTNYSAVVLTNLLEATQLPNATNGMLFFRARKP